MSLRPLALAAVGLLSSLVAFVLAASAAQAADREYVALGDSYASGVGTRTYYNDGSTCLRSPYAYPALNAIKLRASLTFAACSGAKTAGVVNGQLGALDAATRYVTLTVGGNDAGFSRVIKQCAQPWWSSNCGAAIDEAQTYIRPTLPADLDRVYAAVSARAPAATVVVVGYPRMFNGEDCNAGPYFSPTEERRLNETADLLDGTVAARVAAAGLRFVDPTTAFIGHAICDDAEWLNGLSRPVRESYHPNRAGQRAFADLTIAALRG